MSTAWVSACGELPPCLWREDTVSLFVGFTQCDVLAYGGELLALLLRPTPTLRGHIIRQHFQMLPAQIAYCAKNLVANSSEDQLLVLKTKFQKKLNSKNMAN